MVFLDFRDSSGLDLTSDVWDKTPDNQPELIAEYETLQAWVCRGRRGQQELPVSNEIRVVESEIDSEIRSLTVWKSARAVVLRGLMGVYRDLIELGFVEALDANLFGTNRRPNRGVQT